MSNLKKYWMLIKQDHYHIAVNFRKVKVQKLTILEIKFPTREYEYKNSCKHFGNIFLKTAIFSFPPKIFR